MVELLNLQRFEESFRMLNLFCFFLVIFFKEHTWRKQITLGTKQAPFLSKQW